MPDSSTTFHPRGRAKDWTEIAIASLLNIGQSDYGTADTLWRRHVAPAYRGVLMGDGYGFDQETQQYTRANGRPISQDDIRKAGLLFLSAVQMDIEDETQRMTHGDVTLADWQDYVADRIKSLYIDEAALAVGGFSRLTQEDLASVVGVAGNESTLGTGLADAYMRLNKFGLDVENGAPRASDPEYIAYRAGSYARPANSMYESAKGESHLRAVDSSGKKIFLSERSVLGPNEDHCLSDETSEGCVEVARAGWQPIDSLPEPGERTCGPNCLCHIEYSTNSPDELNAGNQ